MSQLGRHIESPGIRSSDRSLMREPYLKQIVSLKILFREKPGMLHVNPDCKEEFENCLNLIIKELHEQKKRWHEAVSGLFRYLLIQVGRLPEKGSPEAMEYTLPVRKAVDFLQTHLAEKISLREVAIAAGIGKSSLCRKFRKEVGKTPWELLNSLRIRKAVFYLGTRNRPSISETAYLCGFEDSGYFSRIFRRETGISPSCCRDGFKNLPVTSDVFPDCGILSKSDNSDDSNMAEKSGRRKK